MFSVLAIFSSIAIAETRNLSAPEACEETPAGAPVPEAVAVAIAAAPSPEAAVAAAPVVSSTSMVAAPKGPPPEQTLYHGFRVGYTYLAGLDAGSPLQTPHLFVLGYELTQRAVGGRWLDVVVIGNGSVAGINQSMFLPSLNGLVGFAIDKQLEVGTGISLTPFDPSQKYVHQVVAVGWTPPAGAFNLPIHITYIPDVDGHWRLGTTVGVNW